MQRFTIWRGARWAPWRKLVSIELVRAAQARKYFRELQDWGYPTGWRRYQLEHISLETQRRTVLETRGWL